MTGAKDRMREKKMKHQPRNVPYTSSGRGAGRGQGSQVWVRGHQAGGHGYSQDLPKYITASYFARARAAEVSAMLKAVSRPAGSCHVFNALPKHMRRRAMSHDCKRLPTRLREGALRLAERSQRAPDQQKKPVPKSRSRRARRRHGNLLLEFNRRQQESRWLETHIWHSKRFHMRKSWSFCVPLAPTAKGYRAAYRAMDTHALLQDLSYFCCLEIQGSEEQILRALARLTNKQTGRSLAAVSCVSGARQGIVQLYRSDCFPRGALGPAEFLWRPRAPDAALRQLWIWLHPALKQDVLSELLLVCGCSPAVSEDLHPEADPAGRKRKSDEGDAGPPPKRLLGDGTRPAGAPVRWESPDTHITISDLTLEIVRFRLIGPLAHTVLTDTLRPASEMLSGEDDSLHRQQTHTFQLLRGVCSTAELPAGCVLGLTVDDPRLTLPQKRGKTVPDLQPSTEEDDVRDLRLRGVAAHCSQSSLWDESIRECVTRGRLSDQELNRRRSDLLVPGSRLSSSSAVPVLLVHHAGRVCGEERRHWGSGWDLLLPKGWGMAFWVPLVYRGVRVGGLHMSLKHSQFKGQPHFPHDYPDCPAGVRFQAEQELELREKFKRRPPSKRTNYIKHGCLAPFRCPWQQLTEEWEELVSLSEDTASRDDTPFTVLRSLKELRLLSGWIRRRQRLRVTPDPPLTRLRVTPDPPLTRRGVTPDPPLTPAAASALQQECRRSLLWVRLRLLSKGQPALHAMVCVPTTSDLQLLRTEGQSSGPQEPRHTDPPSDPADPERVLRGVCPPPLPGVVTHCSRTLLGWVTQGDFSLTSGCGEALAFISLTGLTHTLLTQPQDQRGLVLLRNPSSLQYRFAQISLDT
ncbi:ribonucleases P/MRP protein subunit POP1 [Pimephales promelas]|uniref:ribonucleases P/MRP protein subunit POP1 n=1 Tax=Pimephales promelas TaxID=90988 RepID=UPI00195571AE|nr:ribonucleases P/MRP protein subunit POP1 [Pimephales promelas]